jgi:hypothetical protein
VVSMLKSITGYFRAFHVAAAGGDSSY